MDKPSESRAPLIVARPSFRLIVPVLLACLYAPIGWIAFTSRAWLATLDGNKFLFFITLPGEWFAQPNAERAGAYYFYSAIATVMLLGLGTFASRKDRFVFLLACCILTGWSAFTAVWLWQDLGPPLPQHRVTPW